MLRLLVGLAAVVVIAAGSFYLWDRKVQDDARQARIDALADRMTECKGHVAAAIDDSRTYTYQEDTAIIADINRCRRDGVLSESDISSVSGSWRIGHRYRSQ